MFSNRPSRGVDAAELPTWRQFLDQHEDFKTKCLEIEAKSKLRYSPVVDKIKLWRGDITKLKIGAIVNAANTGLWPGGGICGAIHDAAGPQLENACEKLGRCETGDAVTTPGFKLPASHVIHAVGPTNRSSKLLASCYVRTLEECVKNSIRSVAFCCISTGIYGFDNDLASHVALRTVREWLDVPENASTLDFVLFCVFLPVDEKLYFKHIPLYFPTIEHEMPVDPQPEDEGKASNPTTEEKLVPVKRVSEESWDDDSKATTSERPSTSSSSSTTAAAAAAAKNALSPAVEDAASSPLDDAPSEDAADSADDETVYPTNAQSQAAAKRPRGGL